MGFYLDDCSDANDLVDLLVQAGHAVRTPRTEGTSGVSDQRHLEYAAAHRLALITRNPKDFRNLHNEWQTRGRTHSGILLIYQDNIKGKDMGPADVVQAVDRLLAPGVPIDNEIHSLNQWR